MPSPMTGDCDKSPLKDRLKGMGRDSSLGEKLEEEEGDAPLEG